MHDIAITVDPAYASLPELVDTKTGFLKWLVRLRVQGGYPKSHFYAARSCSVDLLSTLGQKTPGDPRHYYQRDSSGGQSAGMNVDAKSAFYACVCEQIERYCSGFVGEQTLLWGTELDLQREGLNCMTSSSFQYLSEEQYEQQEFLRPWRSQSKLRWMKCFNLSRRCDIYVPAQLICMPYTYVRNEEILVEQSTSGLACHRALDRASYGALCEVVERDSFFIYWYNMFPAPTIRPESLRGHSCYLDLLLDRVAAIPGLELICKVITSDLEIPTILCVFKHPLGPQRSGLPVMAFAAASALDPVEAMSKALNELFGTFALAGVLATENELCRLRKPGPGLWNDVRTLSDHVAIFTRPEILEYMTWVERGPTIDFAAVVARHSPAPVNAAQPAGAWPLVQACLRQLARCRLEAYIADLTTPDVAALGFKVVRAYVPGAVPITSMHILRPLGLSRVRTTPVALGYASPARLNVVPHPYP